MRINPGYLLFPRRTTADEDIPRRTGQRSLSLEWVQEIVHNSREFPAGPAGITNSLEGGWRFLEAWYFHQAV